MPSDPKGPSNKVISLDELGQLQETDIHTGETKLLDKQIEAEGNFFDKYEAITSAKGNLVYVPRGTDPEVLKELQGANYHWPYSPLLADKITSMVADGGFITRICREPGMPPYPTLAKWRKFHPEFDAAYRQAVRDRAEAFLDKAVNEAEQATEDRDSIGLAKLKADVFKYVAKVGDPDSFGERQNIKADVAVTEFVIETGIRRVGDPGFNKDETREVNTELEGETDE